MSKRLMALPVIGIVVAMLGTSVFAAAAEQSPSMPGWHVWDYTAPEAEFPNHEVTPIFVMEDGFLNNEVPEPVLADIAGIQDKINTPVMQHAVFQYENALPNASELISSGSAVSYEITAAKVTYMGNGLLSARSEGMIDYANDTNDVKFAYSIIIDLSTGRDIAPKKIYSDFGSIITLFTSGKFKQISGEDSLLSSVSLEKLMENYKYYAQYSTYPETYFTEDSLVIILDTDREHGFFAEFSIALTEVNGYLQKSPTK